MGSVHDTGNKASVTIRADVFSNQLQLEACATGSFGDFTFRMEHTAAMS